MRGRVHREGLDRTCDGNEAWRTAEWRKRTSYGRNGGPVDREGCDVPQNGRNGPPTVETGVMLIGRGVAYRKTGLHGILFISTVDSSSLHGLPSTSSSLHGLLFIQPPPRATPPATAQPPLHGHPPPSTVHLALDTTGSCSTTPPRAPLHRLLFIQPSTPRGPVQPPLQGHPSTVYCSSSPPPHHGVLFIQRQRHCSLFIHPPPPPRPLFIPSLRFS